VALNAKVDMSETAGDTVVEASRVRVPKMAELVAQQLRRQIIRGDLHEGAALPSEAVLMKRFGVSRPTLREAFRVLESEGLIRVRRGAHGGARVQVPSGEAAARYAGLVLEFRGATLQDVYEARGVLEPPCARRLASRRTKSDIDRLRENIASARAALDDPATHIRLNNEFHALMIELAGNQTIIVLNSMVREIIDLSSYLHVAEDAGTPNNIRATKKGIRAHELLVDYIEGKDGDEAENIWRKHLTEAQHYMLGRGDPKTVLDLLG
jgi:DNA-binding FadR family transcriptional regulator